MSKIAEYTHFVGVDVSMDWLDVHVLPGDLRFRAANTSRGVWSLIAKLANCDEPLVVLEASGGFEGQALDTLSAAGLAIAMVNPRQVRSFARALGILAKTDRIDAFAIARYAEAVKPAPRAPEHRDLSEIKALMTRRRQLTEMLTEEKDRRCRVTNALVRRRILVSMRSLKKEIDPTDDEFERLIAADETMRAWVALLRSAPGVGKVVACSLIAYAPERRALAR